VDNINFLFGKDGITTVDLILLSIVFLIGLTIVVSFGNSFTIGKFAWRKKTDANMEFIKKEIESLRLELRADKLESRIHDEFKSLRDIAKERKTRLLTSLTARYVKSFNSFCEKYYPNKEDNVEEKQALYKLLIERGIGEVAGHEMVRLVFKNSFLPLPSKGDTPRIIQEKSDAFREDVFERSIYLMTLTSNYIKQEWVFTIAHSTYVSEFAMGESSNTLSGISNYFFEVVSARDLAISAMFMEYGDMYVSFESFKKYVEKRYTEIY